MVALGSVTPKTVDLSVPTDLRKLANLKPPPQWEGGLYTCADLLTTCAVSSASAGTPSFLSTTRAACLPAASALRVTAPQRVTF